MLLFEDLSKEASNEVSKGLLQGVVQGFPEICYLMNPRERFNEFSRELSEDLSQEVVSELSNPYMHLHVLS